jgi:hypothetical protein
MSRLQRQLSRGRDATIARSFFLRKAGKGQPDHHFCSQSLHNKTMVAPGMQGMTVWLRSLEETRASSEGSHDMRNFTGNTSPTHRENLLECARLTIV